MPEPRSKSDDRSAALRRAEDQLVNALRELERLSDQDNVSAKAANLTRYAYAEVLILRDLEARSHG